MVPLHIPISMRYWPPISGRARKRRRQSVKSNSATRNDSSLRSVLLRHLEGPGHFHLVHRRARDRAFSSGALARLYIEKFGIWFGKPLWKKKINGVEYSLG